MAIKRDQKREVTGKLKKEEETIDRSLRPKTFAQFVGQDKTKENLKIILTAANKRKEPIDHILLYGPPGIGKSTLANVIAHEMSSNIRVTSGPALEKAGDLASILTSLEDFDILFIDEIHRLNRIIEELLYPAMEDHALDIILGKGPSAKTLRLDLPKFTIMGATTRVGSISAPMRDRFGALYCLDFYQQKDIKRILLRSARILKVQLKKEAAQEIAKSSRRTPRVANRLLKRVRDFAEVKARGEINKNVVQDALKMLEVDGIGLDKADRKLLRTLIKKFDGGPVGLNTLTAACGEDAVNIEEVYEPYLMRLGFIKRTPRGRVATKRAFEYLNFPFTVPDKKQKSQKAEILKNQEKLL